MIDDDDYSILNQEFSSNFSSSNTPDLPIEEPVNSLSMGDEHLDTIPATESDEVIKSSVKDPVPIPRVREIDLFLDNSIPPGIDNDDDSEGDILPLEELLDNVLFPLPESDDFTVDVEPVAAMTNDFDVLNNDEPFDLGGGENVVFLNVEEDDSFTFTIRTFLPFVTYPEASPLSCSTGSEDTIFEPTASCLGAWVYHTGGAFIFILMKPVEIFFSICLPHEPTYFGVESKRVDYGYPDFDDSRAHGFIHSYIRASYPQLHLGNLIS
ncbi:hypothetical protein Tco_1099573 [Tanacetum coccineum]